MNDKWLKIKNRVITAATIAILVASIIPLGFAEEAPEQIQQTDGGTLEVGITPLPSPAKSGHESKLKIDFIDKDEKIIQVHVDYTVFVTKNDQEILSVPLTHTSLGTVKIPLTFPEDGVFDVRIGVEGIWFIPMPEEVTSFIIHVGETITKTETSLTQEETIKVKIPDWIKQVAEFWIADKIDDEGFVQVIEYLVSQGIITIAYSEEPEGDAVASIPSWIKTNAEFWVKGDISDDEFAVGIEWLINNGIIKVQNENKRVVLSYEIEGNYYPIYQFGITPISPDCPDNHLHATSGYTVDAVLVTFTDPHPGKCGLGTIDSLAQQPLKMTENQILEWEKVSGIIIPEN